LKREVFEIERAGKVMASPAALPQRTTELKGTFTRKPAKAPDANSAATIAAKWVLEQHNEAMELEIEMDAKRRAAIRDGKLLLHDF
jgi:hypothetical protein